MKHDFSGTGVALVTPFHPDGRIDFSGLEKLVRHCLKGGVDYLVVLGTTGESATLSQSEKAEVLACVQATNQGQKPIVLGHGGNHTTELTELMKSIRWEGVDAILSVSPYYNKPSQAGIQAHYEAIATASPVPVILYNVPGRTGSNITASTTLRLAEHPNIIGIKEASGNLEQCMSISAGKPADFQIISGDDLLTPSMMAIGAVGAISVLANSHPGPFSEVVNLCRQNQYGKAATIWKNWIALNPLLYEEGNPVGIKAVLAELQICDAMVRMPLQQASTGLKERIRSLIN
jgi:4-hydroxy-tetrahydrodipicolinate synthase